MPEVSVDGLGQVGVVDDLKPQTTPPNAFSYVLNARFQPDGVESIYSHSLEFPHAATEASIGIAYTEEGASPIWISLSQDTIQACDASTTVEIKNSGLTAPNVATKWNYCYLNGFVIFNNQEDAPFQWDKDMTTNSVDPLANWQSTARCRVIRSFKAFLVALDIDDNGTLYPDMVWWSTAAEPGTVPTSWDYTDEEQDAGRQQLSETPGRVVDGKALGDTFLVYKTDSVWGMTFTGAPYIFRFFKISEAFGCATPNGVISFPGGHVVLTRNDVVRHNGDGNFVSILNYRFREQLFSAVDKDTIEYCFLAKQPEFNEIWICYREADPVDPPDAWESAKCDRAIVWNWQTNTLSQRELPGVHMGMAGAVNADDDQPTLDSLVMVGDGDENFFWMDRYDATVGVATMTLERKDLGLIGRNADGTPRVDNTRAKVFTNFYPRFSFTGSPTVTMQFGGRRRYSDAGAYGSTRVVDKTRLGQSFFINSDLFAYQMEVAPDGLNDHSFCFHGFDLTLQVLGRTI